VRQFAAFAVVGALATGAHFAILVLLVEAMRMAPVAASSVGALAGALVSYHLNYRHTFRSRQRHQVALPRFLGVAILAFAVNALVLAALVRGARVPYLAAQAITTAAVMALTFTLGRRWAFR